MLYGSDLRGLMFVVKTASSVINFGIDRFVCVKQVWFVSVGEAVVAALCACVQVSTNSSFLASFAFVFITSVLEQIIRNLGKERNEFVPLNLPVDRRVKAGLGLVSDESQIQFLTCYRCR